MQNHAILLDSNAGAPLHPLVREALFAFLGGATEGAVLSSNPVYLGNPSSLHAFGRSASASIANAKTALLKTLQASPAEWTVTFTSGGTEANQLAVKGTLSRSLREHTMGKGKRPLWVVSPIEHACVLDLIVPMREAGVTVQIAEVRADGEVVLNDEQRSGATLISVIGINNETGRIQPFVQATSLDYPLTSHILSRSQSPEHKPLLHTDFVAGWGKSELNLSTSDAPDFIAIAAHKLGGLPGIGALVHRKRHALDAQMLGSAQGGLRGGTENLVGILTLQVLAENFEKIRGGISALSALRDAFETELLARIPSAVITGRTSARAPHLSHFSFPGLKRAYSLVQQLDVRGFALSSGSACQSHAVEPSHVLMAMGFAKIDALNAIRMSLHSGNTWKELTVLLDALQSISKRFES